MFIASILYVNSTFPLLT